MIKKEVQKGARQSNIEILRILSMLMIISFHYVYKSGYTYTSLNINTVIVKTFYMFGELGVNLFILITGYFMINGKFKPKKLILILAEVLFYYLLTMFIGIKLGVYSKPNNKRAYFLIFFPTLLSRYWFITVYVIIYILSPYLNIFAKSMSKSEYKKFLMTVLILWCVIPTFFGVFFNSSETILYYSRLIWLLVMYFIGGYIQLYGFSILNSIKKKLICASISFLVMFFSILVIYKLRRLGGKVGLQEIAYFWTPNNIPMFLLSISIFGLFLDFKIKELKIINMIASTTLGIYVLHDGILTSYIWKNIFETKEHLLGKYPLVHILGATLVIFFVGALIDLIRQFIEKNTLSKILDYILTKKWKVRKGKNNNGN